MSNFYGKATTSDLRSTVSLTQDLNGEGLDFTGELAARLAWTEPGERIVISGSSDVTLLSQIRGALLSLKSDVFNGENNIVVSSGGAEFFDRRLLLLEHEIDGLLKRKIHYTLQGEGGRVLDYTGILNEKENQIIELEKKIQNLEERLRRFGKRERASLKMRSFDSKLPSRPPATPTLPAPTSRSFSSEPSSIRPWMASSTN